LGVGPFPQGGLDEPLGLAVCLGCIGPGSDVPEAEVGAGLPEGPGAIAGAVVGHDAGDGDAEAAVVGDGGLEEGNGALLLLVGQDLREGDARGVVDADVDELPAAAAAAIVAGVMAGDAVADLVEAAELLDVEVDQLARLLALVAADRLGRLQVAQSAEAGPAQHAADRRGRPPGRGGDLPADPALPAQLDDLLAGRLSGRLAQPMRPRGPVIEAGRSLGLVALDPFPDRLG